MRNLILAAGVAALAISVPAAAKPDRDNGGRGGKASKVERGGGKAQRVQARGRAGAEVRVAAVQRRADDRREARTERRDERKPVRVAQRDDRRDDRKRVEQRNDRRDDRKQVRVAQRDDRRDDRKRVEQRNDRRDDRKQVRVEQRNDRRDDRRVVIADRRRDDDRNVVRVRDRDNDRERRMARIFGDRVPRAFVNNCPPGLAMKNNGCMPPGLVGRDRWNDRFDDDSIVLSKSILGQRLPTTYQRNVLPLRLRNIYRDDNRFTYRYGDGYVYRVDRERQLVSALLPLIGAGLGLGMPFPYSGANYMVPSYYQPFYRDRNDDYFRYANGYVYEIDRDTGLIENMTPLLDRGYGIGQMLPASYGTYNVPYHYRSMYYDTPDYAYRYAPGAIYQVDPTTQLITAVASLLAPGMSVGQQLPPAYSAYNVPMGYRDMYYDTPDSWYRYNNGHIYQVDPTTQLVTALVRAIV